jgi:uncharacterized UBP type Zn finger protein
MVQTKKGDMKCEECPHLPRVSKAAPHAAQCEDCGAEHSLRVCATCGHVGCCESQAGHDRDHWKATGHPIIRSLPLSDRSFVWCYDCNEYLF